MVTKLIHSKSWEHLIKVRINFKKLSTIKITMQFSSFFLWFLKIIAEEI